VRRSFPHPACATHSDTTHEVCHCPTQLRSHSFLPPFVLLAEGVRLVKARSSESHALPSMLLYARPPDGTTQPSPSLFRRKHELERHMNVELTWYYSDN
jgi:hypothetical protein